MKANYSAVEPKQQMRIFSIAPPDVLEKFLDPQNYSCPYHGYVGNEDAVRLVIRLAKRAYESRILVNGSWYCNRENPVRMLLTGPRSVGKTTFAKRYAKLVGVDHKNGKLAIPWLEIDSSAISSREEIFEKVKNALQEAGCPLIPWKVVGGVRHYLLPPLIMFLDEVHMLPKKVMEGLLKLTEPSDGMFEVGNHRLDCKRFAIIAATTDPGKLKDTLKSRFPIKIILKKHTLEQVATIIENEFCWDREDAEKLARLKPIPREALEIGKLVDITSDADNCTISEAIDIVAKDMGLAEGGLTAKAVDALVALAEAQPSGLSKKNLCVQLELDEDSFQYEILPQLLKNEFHSSLVTVSSRHKITDYGLLELQKRGLSGW